jgi:hypothetical protein
MTTALLNGDAATMMIWRWLQEHNAAIADAQLDLDIDLVDTRILRSLDLMNFIFFLEDLSEREIEITDARSLEQLRTLRAIRDNLLNAEDAS